MHATDLGLNLSLMNQILACMQASNQKRRKFKEVFWEREEDTTRWERGLGQWNLRNSEEELCCFLDIGVCGKCNQTHPHLQAKWNVLIQEYLHQLVKLGGWGLKNIFHFTTALSAKNVWRLIKGEGLWCKVVIQKYIYPASVEDWIRCPTKSLNNVSVI